MKRSLLLAILTLSLASVQTSLSYAQTEKPANTSSSQVAQALSKIPRGTPVVMLNMLKYRDIAEYANSETTMTGEEAYAKYREGASKLVAKVGGEAIWFGDAKASLIAPAGETWDRIFLVRYPSIEKFIEMTSSEAYRAVAVHRTAALKDSRLIATVETEQKK